MHDHFVIYEQVYSDLRQVLNDAAYGKQFQQLREATEVCDHELALFSWCIPTKSCAAWVMKSRDVTKSEKNNHLSQTFVFTIRA